MKYKSGNELKLALAKIGVELIDIGYTGGDFYITVKGDIYEAYEKMKASSDPNYTLLKIEPGFNNNLYIWIY